MSFGRSSRQSAPNGFAAARWKTQNWFQWLVALLEIGVEEKRGTSDQPNVGNRQLSNAWHLVMHQWWPKLEPVAYFRWQETLPRMRWLFWVSDMSSEYIIFTKIGRRMAWLSHLVLTIDHSSTKGTLPWTGVKKMLKIQSPGSSNSFWVTLSPYNGTIIRAN